MSYRITIRLTRSVETLEEAMTQVNSLVLGDFKQEVEISTDYPRIFANGQTIGGAGALAGYAGYAGHAVEQQQTATTAEVATAVVAPKPVKPRATKPVADPAPAPASDAPSPAPAPAPAPASTKAPTHVDLRAILVPVAASGSDGAARVKKFIRDAGYSGTVDTIPLADLPALIEKARKEFQ